MSKTYEDGFRDAVADITEFIEKNPYFQSKYFANMIRDRMFPPQNKVPVTQPEDWKRTYPWCAENGHGTGVGEFCSVCCPPWAGGKALLTPKDEP